MSQLQHGAAALQIRLARMGLPPRHVDGSQNHPPAGCDEPGTSVPLPAALEHQGQSRVLRLPGVDLAAGPGAGLLVTGEKVRQLPGGQQARLFQNQRPEQGDKDAALAVPGPQAVGPLPFNMKGVLFRKAGAEHRVQVGGQQHLSPGLFRPHPGHQMGPQTRLPHPLCPGPQLGEHRLQQPGHGGVARLIAGAAVDGADLFQQRQLAGQHLLRPGPDDPGQCLSLGILHRPCLTPPAGPP